MAAKMSGASQPLDSWTASCQEGHSAALNVALARKNAPIASYMQVALRLCSCTSIVNNERSLLSI